MVLFGMARTRPILLIVMLGVLAAVVCLEANQFLISLDQVPSWEAMACILAYLGYLGLTLLAITQALRFAFQNRSRNQLIAIVLAAYATVALMFACLYYTIVNASDHDDAVRKYRYYELEGRRGVSQKPGGPPLLRDARAFRGMEPRLWSGVDWQPAADQGFDALEADNRQDMFAEFVRRARSRSLAEMVRFLPEGRPWVFLDCLHFSIVTMSTVGYGDITPSGRYTKVAVDLQILSAVLLATVAFGLALGAPAENP
jgi:hypothetical protein